MEVTKYFYVTKLTDLYVRVAMKAEGGEYGLTIDIKGEVLIDIIKAVLAQDIPEHSLQERRVAIDKGY
jgi:hypothetical protein